MAVHDYVISNGTGSAVRSDLNGALAAIVSQNSNASAPATTYAYMSWADTTAGVMKMRNGANSAWISLYELDGTFLAGDISLSAGSAAAPSLFFTGDANTGIYSPGADQVGISTGGTSRITVDGSGNVNIDSNTFYVDAANNRVGIGTTSTTTGKLTLVSDIDPGTTAAGIAVSLSGIGGGTATSQYGIRVTGTGYTNSTNTYGVHSALTQAYIYPAYGGYFSASSYYTQGYGVYAETTCTAPVTAGASYAGYFKANCSAAGTDYTNVGVRVENAATTGSLSRGLYVSTVSGPTTVIPFQVDHAGTERLRIDSSGRLLVGTTTVPTVVGVPANTLVVSSASNDGSWTGTFQGTGASANRGVLVTYPNSSPNDADNQAFYFADSGGSRFQVRSNGGIANYQANNVNLSDRNAKKDISLATDTWNCIKDWEIVNYRYKDQPDDADLNLGVIAQQVAESCPEVVIVFEQATEDQPEKLGIKEQQMYWMTIKALQEAQVRIETLEASNADMLARLSALEGA